MKLSERQYKKHIATIILICFIASMVFGFAGYIIFPPEYINGMPKYQQGLLYFSEIGGATTILAYTLLGIKLADERQVLPSAGFTMMAIASGVFYVTIFEGFSNQTLTAEQLEKAYNIQIGGMILFIPALILTTYYTYFPRWLRVLTIFANVPYAALNFIYMSGNRDYELFDLMGAIGSLTLGTVQILWGVWIWKRRYGMQGAGS